LCPKTEYVPEQGTKLTPASLPASAATLMHELIVIVPVTPFVVFAARSYVRWELASAGQRPRFELVIPYRTSQPLIVGESTLPPEEGMMVGGFFEKSITTESDGNDVPQVPLLKV